MKLRGLPHGVTFDKYYTMNTDWMINGHYTFDGFTITYIMYDSLSDVWRMELRTNPGEYYAKTEAGREKDYPFGTRTWNITSQYYNGSVALNLNGCDDFHQYNCRDGSCIPIEERHDMKNVIFSVFSVYYFAGVMETMIVLMPQMRLIVTKYQYWIHISMRFRLLH